MHHPAQLLVLGPFFTRTAAPSPIAFYSRHVAPQHAKLAAYERERMSLLMGCCGHLSFPALFGQTLPWILLRDSQNQEANRSFSPWSIVSKYGHFIALSHPYTAVSVARAFFDTIVRLHGVPCSIVSDRGLVFFHWCFLV